MQHDNVKLTSAELGLLWSSYIAETMAVCVFAHAIKHIQDVEVLPLVKTALNFSQSHIQSLKTLFTKEQFPIPQGFTNADVNLDAPRLYSDTFYLYYVNGMAIVGMGTNASALSVVSRGDIRQYYGQCLDESKQLHNTSVDIQLQKGIYVKPPMISLPDKVSFIQSDAYLTGFFGEKRPLNGIEIAHLYVNCDKNALGRALLFGFAQVAQSEEVRRYLERGIDIARKHVRVFSDRLLHSNLPSPLTWDSEVGDSTIQTFSDKLMIFHTSILNGVSIADYGMALGTSTRRDLGLMYTRLIAEVGLYAEDGAELAISNGWLEEPPMADNRHELAKSK